MARCDLRGHWLHGRNRRLDPVAGYPQGEQRYARVNQQLQRDIKAKGSLALIALGMALAFLEPLVAYGVYALVSIMWFIPDRRFSHSGNEQKG